MLTSDVKGCNISFATAAVRIRQLGTSIKRTGKDPLYNTGADFELISGFHPTIFTPYYIHRYICLYIYGQ